MGLPAFYPQVGSINIALTSAASVGVSVSSLGGPAGITLFNGSTNDAYIWFFPTSTGAATLPTTSAVGLSTPVPQRGQRYFSTPPVAFVSGLTTAAALTALITITPGYGLP